ncbi:MAG: MarR family winged helix-turn-helix transcriptional regulator [Ruminiclostridium sp.]
MRKEDHLGFKINTISHLIKRGMDMKNESANIPELTRSQVWVIKYLSEECKNVDIYQRDLEKAFNIRRSTATGMLQLMEKKGLIRRLPVPHDARMKKLVLTDYAIQISERMEKNIDTMEETLRKGITEEEIRVFNTVCNKIMKNLE